MIADEITSIEKPCELSEAQGRTLECIKKCIVMAIIPFKKAKSERNMGLKLNEKKLTQILVHQIQFQLMKISSIIVNSEYSDVHFGTKGIPDFYFYYPADGKEYMPLFVVESKRLPVPNNIKKREKEYVLGNANNGGIERFKKEIHGKHFYNCGMIGFVEKFTSSYWLNMINTWIRNIAEIDPDWNDDEQLELLEDTDDYCHLMSIVRRKITGKNVLLYHWWIIC